MMTQIRKRKLCYGINFFCHFSGYLSWFSCMMSFLARKVSCCACSPLNYQRLTGQKWRMKQWSDLFEISESPALSLLSLSSLEILYSIVFGNRKPFRQPSGCRNRRRQITTLGRRLWGRSNMIRGHLIMGRSLSKGFVFISEFELFIDSEFCGLSLRR